jgi:hypothetical protein
MLPAVINRSQLRAAFWRAIEGISADQICTTSRDDTAFSMNLRKSDRRDLERRFEREMQQRKAKPSAKQVAPEKKEKALKRAIWAPARVFKEGQLFAPWLKISPPEILETSKLQLIEFSVFDSVGGRSQYLKVRPVATNRPLLGFMQIKSTARKSMINRKFRAVI